MSIDQFSTPTVCVNCKGKDIEHLGSLYHCNSCKEYASYPITVVGYDIYIEELLYRLGISFHSGMPHPDKYYNSAGKVREAFEEMRYENPNITVVEAVHKLAPQAEEWIKADDRASIGRCLGPVWFWWTLLGLIISLIVASESPFHLLFVLPVVIVISLVLLLLVSFL